MQLAATFKAHFATRCSNYGGNQNAKGYDTPMNAKLPLEVVIKALSHVKGVMLTANTKKGVKLIHGLHKFRNTLLWLENKIDGFRMGSKAFVGVVDNVNAISQLTIKVPSQEDITTCNTIDKLCSLAKKKPTNL